MFRLEQLKRKCRAHIDGEITIYNAATLKDQLASVLDDPRQLEIDLANVSEIDSAGVQLLMLAKKHRAGAGHALALTNHSPAVLDVFETMGLVSYFSDPVVLTRTQGDRHGS